MLKYVGRRTVLMVPTVFAISLVAFAIIQLPPGDFLTTMVTTLEEGGTRVDAAQLAVLKEQYGLGDPVHVQYWKWITGILTRGDFGTSFNWSRPVSDLLGDRLGFTILLSVTALVFVWVVAFPIGVYSAVRQYSPGDYLATTFGFLGLATPNFLIALVLMWIGFRVFGQSVGGLFSPEFQDAPWSLARVGDLLAHLWVPVVVVGTAGTAGLIRILRANLLDELRRPYVVAARARGVPERRLVVKYPLRAALNPFISTIGWVLPGLISGEVIVSQVMSLPTTGSLLLGALTSEDMYLAGSVIFLVSVLTVIGTLVSDVLLAWLDPRIRLGYR